MGNVRNRLKKVEEAVGVDPLITVIFKDPFGRDGEDQMFYFRGTRQIEGDERRTQDER